MATEFPVSSTQATIDANPGDFTKLGSLHFGKAKLYIWQERLMHLWFGHRMKTPTTVQKMRDAINDTTEKTLFGPNTIDSYLKELVKDEVWVIIPSESKDATRGTLQHISITSVANLENNGVYAYAFVRSLRMPSTINFSSNMNFIISSITADMLEDIRSKGDDTPLELSTSMPSYNSFVKLMPVSEKIFATPVDDIKTQQQCADEWIVSIYRYMDVQDRQKGCVNYLLSDLPIPLQTDASVKLVIFQNMASTIPLSGLKKFIKVVEGHNLGQIAPPEFMNVMSGKKRARPSSTSTFPVVPAIPMSGPTTLSLVAATSGGSGQSTFPTVDQTSSSVASKYAIIVNTGLPPQQFPNLLSMMQGTVGHAMVHFQAQDREDNTKLKAWFKAPLFGSGCDLVTKKFPFVNGQVDFKSPTGKVVGPSIPPTNDASDVVKMTTSGSTFSGSPWTTASIVYHDSEDLRRREQLEDVQFPLSNGRSSYLGELNQGVFHGNGRLDGVIKWSDKKLEMPFTLHGRFFEGKPKGLCRMSFHLDQRLPPVVWTCEWIDDDATAMVSKKGYLRIPKSVSLNSTDFVRGTPDEMNESKYDRVITVNYVPRDSSNPDYLITSMKLELARSQEVHDKLIAGNGYWYRGMTWGTNEPRFLHLANTYSQDERFYLCQKSNSVLFADFSNASVGALKRLFDNQLSTQIGYGADCYTGTGPYNELVLDAAFAIVYPKRMYEYMSAQESFTSKPHIKERAMSVMTHQRNQYASQERMYHKIKLNNNTTTGFDMFMKQEPTFSLKSQTASYTQPPMQTDKNENLLFHGTPSSFSVANIIASGFEPPNRGARFGQGVYFADSITKSDQYATPDKLTDPTELNKSLDVHEALLKLLDISQEKAKNEGHKHRTGRVPRTDDEPQLYVMLLVRVRMGVSLQLFEDEFIQNSVTTSVRKNGAMVEDQKPFAVVPKQANDSRNELEFDYVTPGHSMKSMTELHPLYDSLTIRGWSRASSSQADSPKTHDSERPTTKVHAYEATPTNALRFLEVILYGKQAENAIPVGIMIYHRKYNENKPHVEQRQDYTTGIKTPWRVNPTMKAWNYNDNPTQDPYNFDRFVPPNP